MIKILATVGPASIDRITLEKFSQHTKLFRLNGSHNEIDWHKKAISKIRKICPDSFILLDIPGVKPRTTNSTNIEIAQSQEILFGSCKTNNKYFNIKLTKPLPKYNKDLEHFSLNDGQYPFDIIEYGNEYIVGKSRSNFTLLPKKGINLPNSVYNETQQLDIYSNFIDKISMLDINGLGLSFVQTGDLVNSVRKIAPNLVLVSKIENSEGLRNCNDIIKNSDAIMIDRGDLAAEIGLSNLYSAIDTISASTKNIGKPLIMATENLESMINKEVPSKSDVMSIVHSISIGTDCIMLSEETATAINALQILKWLHEFCSKINPNEINVLKKKSQNLTNEIWKLVDKLESIPALIMTKSGYALFDYIAVKRNDPIIMVTTNKKIISISKLFSNKIDVINSKVNDNTPIETIWEVIEKNKKMVFKDNNKIIAIYVSKYVKGARANCLTFFDKKDFF